MQKKMLYMKIGSHLDLIRLWWMKKRGWRTVYVEATYPNTWLPYSLYVKVHFVKLPE